ncbi:TPA: tRNA CCA-pyrophosphorylase, partial [Streptococcus pneumoniae]
DLLSKLILRRQEQLEELNLLVKSQLAIQKSLEELETLKKSLMQEYFG